MLTCTYCGIVTEKKVRGVGICWQCWWERFIGNPSADKDR
jgi:hypothetical protein